MNDNRFDKYVKSKIFFVARNSCLILLFMVLITVAVCFFNIFLVYGVMIAFFITLFSIMAKKNAKKEEKYSLGKDIDVNLYIPLYWDKEYLTELTEILKSNITIPNDINSLVDYVQFMINNNQMIFIDDKFKIENLTKLLNNLMDYRKLNCKINMEDITKNDTDVMSARRRDNIGTEINDLAAIRKLLEEQNLELVKFFAPKEGFSKIARIDGNILSVVQLSELEKMRKITNRMNVAKEVYTYDPQKEDKNNAEEQMVVVKVTTNVTPSTTLPVVKKRYIEEKLNKDILGEFLIALVDSPLFIPITVLTTEENKELISQIDPKELLSSNIVRMVVDWMKQKADDQDVFLPIFSNFDNIPEDYSKGPISLIPASIETCLSIASNNKNCIGLVLDPFNEPVTITDKLLDILTKIVEDEKKFENLFVKNGFNTKIVNSEKFINFSINGISSKFPFATNSNYNIPETDISFAVAIDSSNKKYLFVNKEYIPSEDNSFSSPYRTNYEGLTDDKYKTVYPFDEPVKIKIAEDIVLEMYL